MFHMALAVGLIATVLVSANPVPQPSETVIRLNVQPMAAPRPSLKYQLLPELREMTPGNVVQGYLKCFMEQNHFFFHKESIEQRERYLALPLSNLPVKDLRNYGRIPLKQADHAARLDVVDWQVLPLLRRDGISLLLPEVQQIRTLAAVLKVRFRVEVADGRFDDAIQTAKTLFAMSRHMSEHPTLISSLVGLAIAGLSLDPLEEMVGRPGAPNLYWALMDLPSPFIELRKGLQGERMFLLDAELPRLRDPEPMSEAEVKKVRQKVVELFKLTGDGPKEGVESWIDRRTTDAAYLAAARKRILARGGDAKLVERYPAVQVLLVEEGERFDEERDHLLKWMNQPYWIAEKALGSTLDRKVGDGLFVRLLPSISRVKQVQVLVQQRIAALTIIEALRLHTAEHRAFPTKLAEVKLPLPVDPVTGREFNYSLEAGKVVLRGTTPRGMETNPRYNRRYEITLRE